MADEDKDQVENSSSQIMFWVVAALILSIILWFVVFRKDSDTLLQDVNNIDNQVPPN